MIVESVFGGTVLVLTAIGIHSSFRCVQQRLTRGLKLQPSNQSDRQISPMDPTPSFTVELVRTVLEHQARREDQSRHQLALLVMQMTTPQQCSDCSPKAFLDPLMKPLPHLEGDAVPRTCDGLVLRTIRRLLPGLRK